MKDMHLSRVALLAGLSLLACDGQQYVSPDTVLLTVTHDKTGSVLVEACNFVPVLLGSKVEKHYAVEGAMETTLTITRSDIAVTFQNSGENLDPFHVAPKHLEEGNAIDDYPPTGYTVELASGCTVDTDL
jgi:hypothetical protein